MARTKILMRCIKLTIAYDGTSYSGWQRQPGQLTVQGALESAWKSLTGESVRIAGSSRTDAGVHALGQVASLVTESRLETRILRNGLNAKLSTDIVVLEVEEAPADFHATDTARRKRYRYQIHNHRLRTVLNQRITWHVPYALDVEAMHRAGQGLVGRHDFACFQSVGSQRESTIRTIHELLVRKGQGGEPDRVDIEVEGDGFLYHMVRTIAGTLVEIGRGARPETWIADVLASRDRSLAGPTAPPHGLFLVSVHYHSQLNLPNSNS
ncbi:MAG: tRNA pseudouridine(38-40) synthase TruA [Pirellulales bacterium]|nr:tRNA pseudouridine(38-40) synthase TruA [Pirellulales bacterium]